MCQRTQLLESLDHLELRGWPTSEFHQYVAAVNIQPGMLMKELEQLRFRHKCCFRLAVPFCAVPGKRYRRTREIDRIAVVVYHDFHEVEIQKLVKRFNRFAGRNYAGA